MAAGVGRPAARRGVVRRAGTGRFASPNAWRLAPGGRRDRLAALARRAQPLVHRSRAAAGRRPAGARRKLRAARSRESGTRFRPRDETREHAAADRTSLGGSRIWTFGHLDNWTFPTRRSLD